MADDLSAQGSSLRARQTKGSTDVPEERTGKGDDVYSNYHLRWRRTPKFRLDRHHKTIGAGLIEREAFVVVLSYYCS